MNPPAEPRGEERPARMAEEGQDRSAGGLTRSNPLQPADSASGQAAPPVQGAPSSELHRDLSGNAGAPGRQSTDLPRHTHYQVGCEIAHGGMGSVLEAQDQSLGRVVAMKVILPGGGISDDSRERFLQEAKVLSKLEHPNIVPVYDLGIDSQGRVFYTMKLVRGVTLQHVLDEVRAEEREAVAKYPLNHLLTIFQKVCDAVAFAHSKGVLHRDLKPANIMIGEFGEVQVMDWGLAKVRAAAEGAESAGEGPQIENCIMQNANSREALHTLDGQIMGSPNFMAPEQAAGRASAIDERTDIYGLGGILYSILTLRPPIATGSSMREMLDQVRMGEIRPPTEYSTIATTSGSGRSTAAVGLPHCPGRKVPAPLSAIALKSLATRSVERYQTAAELQEDITAYQNGFVTSAEQPNPLLLARLWIRRHRVAFGVISGFTLLAAVASVVVVTMWLELRGTASTFYDKSQALVAVGRLQEALPPIEYAIRLEPKNAAYHNVRGNILQSLLEIPKARDAYALALKLDPGRKAATENLQLCEGILRSHKDRAHLPSEALSELHAAMISQARLAEAHAIIRMLLKREGKARNEFLTTWQTRLRQAGLKGELTVGDEGRVELRLEGAAVRDISALQGLPLNALILSQTAVSNISVLKGMPLEHLSILGGQLNDISALRGMPLVRLSLANTKVRDLSPLTGMPLAQLEIQGTPVFDLRPLRGLPLKVLFLYSTPVKDFSPISGLSLNHLELSGTAFWDTQLLQEMPLLELGAIATGVTNLTGLSGSTMIKLDLQKTPVKNISALRNRRFLSLLLSDSKVADLSPLRDVEVGKLSLERLPIVDLSPLEGSTLTQLFLEGCAGIRDLTPLVKCDQLEVLTIPLGAMNAHVLRDLPKLKRLGYTSPQGNPDLLPAADEFWRSYDAQHK